MEEELAGNSFSGLPRLLKTKEAWNQSEHNDDSRNDEAQLQYPEAYEEPRKSFRVSTQRLNPRLEKIKMDPIFNQTFRDSLLALQSISQLSTKRANSGAIVHTFEPVVSVQRKHLKLDSSQVMRQIRDSKPTDALLHTSLEPLTRSSSTKRLQSPQYQLNRSSTLKEAKLTARSEYQLMLSNPQLKNLPKLPTNLSQRRASLSARMSDKSPLSEETLTTSHHVVGGGQSRDLDEEVEKVREVYPDFRIQGLKDFSKYPLERLDPGWDPRIDYGYVIRDHPKALSRFTNKDGEVIWMPCTVTKYDKETHEFTIVWDQVEPQEEHRPRLPQLKQPKLLPFSKEAIRARFAAADKSQSEAASDPLFESRAPEKKTLTKKVRKLNLVLHGESISEQESIRHAALAARSVNLLSLSLKDAILHDKPAPEVRILFPSSCLERIRQKGRLSYEEMQSEVEDILDSYSTNLMQFYVEYHKIERLEDFENQFKCSINKRWQSINVSEMNILSIHEHINEEYIEDETLVHNQTDFHPQSKENHLNRGELKFSRYSRPFIGYSRKTKEGDNIPSILKQSIAEYLSLGNLTDTTDPPKLQDMSSRKLSRKQSIETAILPRDCKSLCNTRPHLDDQVCVVCVKTTQVKQVPAELHDTTGQLEHETQHALHQVAGLLFGRRTSTTLQSVPHQVERSSS